MTPGSNKYKEAQEKLKNIGVRIGTIEESHYTLNPTNIQYAGRQNKSTPYATFIGLPEQAFNEKRRVNLGHSSETSQGHLENRIHHQLTVFGQNTPEILTGNARTNKALLKAQQELETPTPAVINPQNAQIFTTPSSNQPTPKGKNNHLTTALGITAGTVGVGFGAGIIQQNLQAPKTNTQEATTEVTPVANTNVATEVPSNTTPNTPVQPIIVPTPQAKDTATSQLEALKTALPEAKGATIERTEGKHTIAKDTQGYRYIISNLGNGSTQVVKIDDQFPPQQAPEVIVQPGEKGAVIRQIGKANIASKQGYDIQGIDAQAVSDKVKASLPEALLSSTQFGRSAYLDGQGNTQTYDIGTVKLQGQSGRMLTLVANQDGTIKGYEQTPEDIKANRATETTLNKDSVQALLTAGDYSVMAQ